MRLFFKTGKKNMTTKLEPYFCETRNLSYIWSEDGLLQVINNKIYRIRIQDAPVINTLLGAFPVTLDPSEYIREDECYQVLPTNYPEFLTQKIYKISLDKKVEWVFEYQQDTLRDNYFLLPEGTDIHSAEIKADLLQFMSMRS